ncbi:MAG: TIGR02678 family protein [Lachnospiraceae bacterium]|nr:TIGR02678 family protein [Lachnospiraceae bacterium]
MNALELLLGRRWIVKEQNKDLYYKVKDEIGSYKKFITEKLGFPLLMNQYIIRLEKTPALPEAWMGIREFQEIREYEFLCFVLMFLEDKDAGEQFILSQLTEYIQMTDKYEEINWTHFHTRKNLIRVMKFCIDSGMIRVNDGSSEEFALDYEKDVLYENIGNSRYFMRNFTQNIEQFSKPEDFMGNEWIGMNEDRGIIRRQRVYRSLVMGMGVYKEDESDETFAYIKNFRNMIEEDLSELFSGELQVHKTSAYLVLEEGSGLGKGIPEENGLSDILLLLNGLLREKIDQGDFFVSANDWIELEEVQFQHLLEECKERYGAGFIKAYREKTTGDFARTIKEHLIWLEWIHEDKKEQRIFIKPIMGKITGEYPKDYAGRAKDEQ